jgi:hypothetical protein
VSGCDIPGTDRENALLVNMFACYDARGFIGNSLALRTVLGWERRSLRNYISELAEQTRHKPAASRKT